MYRIKQISKWLISPSENNEPNDSQIFSPSENNEPNDSQIFTPPKKKQKKTVIHAKVFFLYMCSCRYLVAGRPMLSSLGASPHPFSFCGDRYMFVLQYPYTKIERTINNNEWIACLATSQLHVFESTSIRK